MKKYIKRFLEGIVIGTVAIGTYKIVNHFYEEMNDRDL